MDGQTNDEITSLTSEDSNMSGLFSIVSAAVSALDGCESRAIRIGTCIKNTVDKVLEVMRNNKDSK